MTKKEQQVVTLNTTVAAVLGFCKHHADLWISLAAALIYYGPSLGSYASHAGFLYTGDVLGWFLPQLMKVHSLISSFHFSAIDFSSYNGSSDYFLSPAFFFYHPLVILYGLLAPAKAATLRGAGFFLVFFLAVHSFVSCYFSIKLLRRFFFFEPGPARLAGISFAFSIYTVYAFFQPPFLVCASIIPWAAYSTLHYQKNPTIRKLLFSCLPVIIGFTGGYMPLGITGIALAAMLVAIQILIVHGSEEPLTGRLQKLFVAYVPFVLASFIAGPFLYSVYSFHLESPSNTFASLAFSAHEFAEVPQSLLWIIFPNLSRVVPLKRAVPPWGIVFSVIAFLFLLSKKPASALTPQEWRTLKVFAVIAFVTLLAIFGNYSAVSDLFYYLIPLIGKMHIYQRFLLPAHLMLAAVIALMLKAVVEARPQVAIRIAVAIFGLSTCFAAYLVAFKPALSSEYGLNNAFVFDLFLAFLFACLLLVPGKAYVYTFTVMLYLLPHVNAMYDYSNETTVSSLQKNRIALDENEISGILSYFKEHSDRSVIKFLDLTPFWTKEDGETFPKSFSYLTVNQLPLSSYGGFASSHGARAEYIERIPVAIEAAAFATRIDWALPINTGADYVVVREVDAKESLLGDLYQKTDKAAVHHLPNGVVVFPFADPARKALSLRPALFDNGYFRISSTKNTVGEYTNIALKKPARQCSTGVGKEAYLAVDGDTNGDFAHGSVTHTGMDPNAWLDIDLGSSAAIDSVRVWNRTDAAQSRLSDYWVFLSNEPFRDEDTAATLQSRPGTWSSHQQITPRPASTVYTGGVQARYVRVQLSGTKPLNDSFLSLAEVEVLESKNAPAADAHSNVHVKEFATDFASSIRLEFEASIPVIVQYLFFDNPRLAYYLNGQRASKIKKDGLCMFEAPAGQNILEIRYVHWPLRLFFMIYLLYAAACLCAILPTAFLHMIAAAFSQKESGPGSGDSKPHSARKEQRTRK